MTDHPRIYLQPECCATPDVGRAWCQDDEPVECPDGEPWTCYVRAPTDEALRALIRSVAQATVERCAEVFVGEWTRPDRPASELTARKHEIADDIAEATMWDADEDPEAPVNALRHPTRETMTDTEDKQR